MDIARLLLITKATGVVMWYSLSKHEKKTIL